MSYYTTRTAYATTGIKTITCGFQPVGMRITACAKNGQTNSTIQQSVGTADGTRQNYLSLFHNNNFYQSKDNNNKIISLYDEVAGSLTEVVAATFDSFTATEGKFNLSVTSNLYGLQIELWN